jgi:hypothetical protein
VQHRDDRYCERIGLLPLAHRPGGRLRRYDAHALRDRALSGARGNSASRLMRFGPSCGSPAMNACAEARGLVATHVADIRAKIAVAGNGAGAVGSDLRV